MKTYWFNRLSILLSILLMVGSSVCYSQAQSAAVDTTPPVILFGEEAEEYFNVYYNTPQHGENFFDRQHEEEGYITASIECSFYFPEDFYGFPPPTVSDNSSGKITVTYQDRETQDSVRRTWKAVDEAGNSSTFDFLIVWNRINHEPTINSWIIKQDPFSEDDFSQSVCVGENIMMAVYAVSGCNGDVVVNWYLDDDDIEDFQGPKTNYTWNTIDNFNIRVKAIAVHRGGSKDMNGTIVVNGPRFSINKKDVSCFGRKDGEMEIILQDDVTEYEWWNGSHDATVNGLGAGAYSIQAWDNIKQCTVKQTLNVTQPATITAHAAATPELCENNCNGSLKVTDIRGGTPPFTAAWADNTSGKIIGTAFNQSGVCDGRYRLSLTDAHQCVQRIGNTYTIAPGDARPAAKFSVAADTIDLGKNESFIFHNESTGAATSVWYVSDGSTIESADQVVQYKPEKPGDYTVKLVAASTHGCPDSVQLAVHAINSTVTGVEADPVSSAIKIYPNPSAGIVSITNENQADIKSLKIVNNTGREITTLSGVGKKIDAVDVSMFGSGVYMMILTLDEKTVVYKRMVVVK